MSKIKSIDYFACGSCQNQQKLIFKNQPAQVLTFQAGVFLIEHEDLGYILYDTGYNANVMTNTPKYLAYRLPNPITMTDDLQIDYQLKARGISPLAIDYVIVSHLHPDHIGRLSAFTNAEFIMTKNAFETYQKPAFRDLVFSEYFPDDFEDRLHCLELTEKSTPLAPKLCKDLFKDGSIFAISLDGHAKGQLCLYIPDWHLLIAADVLWGMWTIDIIKDMKPIPKYVQNDFQAYQENIPYLKDLQKKGIAILFCHENPSLIREVLDANKPLS